MDIRKSYIILGLDDNATLEEAHEAYRDLSFVWHPDRFSDRNLRLKKKAEERFMEINKAFKIVETHIKQGKRHGFYNTSYETEEDKSDSFQNISTVREGKGNKKGRKYSIIASLILVMLGVLGISGFKVYQYMKEYLSVVVNDKMPNQQLKSFEEDIKRITRSLEVQLPPKEKKSEIVTEGKKKNEAGNIAEENRKTNNLVESIKITVNNSEEPLEKTEISSLLKRVDAEIDRADLLISSEKFNKSKKSYEMALNMIEKSNFKRNEAISRRRAYIQNILEDPRIVFGSKGYIC